MQEESDSLRKFLDSVEKLSVLYGFSTVQTCIKIGLARSLYYQIKDGKRPITDKLWRKLEAAEQAAGIGEKKPGDVFRSGEVKDFPDPTEKNLLEPQKSGGTRMIPVIGWAHAGDAGNYEEIPESWQERVPTECRDPKAFAVRLEGDSMAPAYAEGDLLIVQPGEEIYSGCLAVIKMHSDGYVFRRIEIRKDFLRLIPLNPQWPSEELPTSDIAWAYPLYGMWRQVWKR